MSDLWQWVTQNFFTYLWGNPDRRKRWALRWRTQDSVRDVATELGWSAAISLDRIIPMPDLTITIRHAVLDELATGQQLRRDVGTRRRRRRPTTGSPTKWRGCSTG